MQPDLQHVKISFPDYVPLPTQQKLKDLLHWMLMAASYSPGMRVVTRDIAAKKGFELDKKGRLPGEFYAHQVLRMFDISEKQRNPGAWLDKHITDLKNAAREGQVGVDMGSPKRMAQERAEHAKWAAQQSRAGGHLAIEGSYPMTPHQPIRSFWKNIATEERSGRERGAPSTSPRTPPRTHPPQRSVTRVQRHARHAKHRYRETEDRFDSPSPERTRSRSPEHPAGKLPRGSRALTRENVLTRERARRSKAFKIKLPAWVKPPPRFVEEAIHSEEDKKKI